MLERSWMCQEHNVCCGTVLQFCPNKDDDDDNNNNNNNNNNTFYLFDGAFQATKVTLRRIKA